MTAAAALPAARVAVPALQWLAAGPRGTVLGAGPTAAWVDLGGGVLAVTTREVPLLPNAVASAAGSGALAGVRPGASAAGGPGRLRLGGLEVAWDAADPPSWDPTVPPVGDRAAMRRRAAAVLRTLAGDASGPDPVRAAGPAALVGLLSRAGLATATDPDGATGLAALLAAVRDRDVGLAADAAGRLLGRGPGLTPEGDDLLAAAAATLAAAGWGRADPARPGPAAVLAALAPATAGARTTALGATLLGLAARGLAPEPAGRLLDLGPAGERAWPAALRRLCRLGHSSGLAWAGGIAAALWSVAGDPAGGRDSVSAAANHTRGR